MKKLAIIITHPIQYYVPIFQLLAKRCELKVFYTWGKMGIKAKHDPGFGKTIEWDLPLLDGYNYELLENISKDPGSHHGKGIINPDIIAKIKAFSPNAILVYGYIYHSHFKVMRYFKDKIPIWFRGDSTLLDKSTRWKAIAKKIYLKWIYSYIDKVFYVGTNNKAYFRKYGLEDEQLIFAPHAIDNERFSENRELDAQHLRENLGMAPHDILILFAGKLEPKKNPELLLEAIAELTCQKSKDLSQSPEITKRGKVHLLFVGNGILEEKLKIKVNQYGDENTTYPKITARIHFMDFQNQTQIPIVYQAANIFCLPSQGPGETWGLAVNEAMASGKAILASDKVGCAVDLIKDDVNGYIFKSNDVEDLKEKLSFLINHPSMIIGFGKQSEQLIKNWSFDLQVEQFITTLNATN